jgi:hypothetical protein
MSLVGSTLIRSRHHFTNLLLIHFATWRSTERQAMDFCGRIHFAVECRKCSILSVSAHPRNDSPKPRKLLPKLLYNQGGRDVEGVFPT